MLVQQISSLTLCLTARTPSEKERARERKTHTESVRHMHRRSNFGKKKRHFNKVDNTQTCIVSLRIIQLHTLLICPKYTLFNPHTLGLISQAWSNTVMVSRVKSFHYNAGDSDPVSGESAIPHSTITTPPPHTPIAHAPTSPLMHPYHVMSASCVNLHHGIFHHLTPTTNTTFKKKSLQYMSHLRFVLLCWTKKMMEAVYNADDRVEIPYINTKISTVTKAASSLLLSFTHTHSPYSSPSHSFNLSTHFRVLHPFLSTLENEWAGKWCHIVPIQAQWRVCSFPLE